MQKLLQYEIDNLGTSVFEIQRGSGPRSNHPGSTERLERRGLLLALGNNALRILAQLHSSL